MRKVNLAQAFARFSDHWSPKVAGEVNDSLVKLAKFSGQFDWHHHDREDELFLVVSGRRGPAIAKVNLLTPGASRVSNGVVPLSR